MAYMYWKKGYTLYSPVESVVYHYYDLDYRHNQVKDVEAEAEDGGQEFWRKNRNSGKALREMIIGDPEFRRYMDKRWGVDILGREGSQKATDGGLDPYYFWDPANPEVQKMFEHKD